MDALMVGKMAVWTVAMKVATWVSLQAESLVGKMVLSKVGMWVVEMVESMAA